MKWVLCSLIAAGFCLQACRNGDNINDASLPVSKGPGDSINTTLNSTVTPGSGAPGIGSSTGNLNSAPDTVKKFGTPAIDSPFKKNL